jgi:site-specific DNA-cytosine methylase
MAASLSQTVGRTLGRLFSDASDCRERSRSPPPSDSLVIVGPAASRTDAGAATSQIRAPPQGAPASPLEWAHHLRTCTRDARASLGAQRRPLRVHSAFSGMMSHGQVFRDLGFDFVDLVAAEPKEHARKFAQQNGLWPQHYYRDIRTIIAREAAPCGPCQSACVPPSDHPDVFVAGFSCQPFSQMRGKHLTQIPPHKHAKFDGLSLTAEYLRIWRPLSAVLENTVGFGRIGKFGSAAISRAADSIRGSPEETAETETEEETEEEDLMSGPTWLREHLKDLYFIAWVKLNSTAWIKKRRPRLWIVAVSTDVGTQAMADEACRIAADLQRQRSLFPAATLADVVSPPGSAEERDYLWHLSVSAELADGRSTSRRRSSDQEEPAWCRESRELRSSWRLRNLVGHDAHPLASAQLRGLSHTDRQREVLELFLLRECFRRGLDPSKSADLCAAKENLTVDVSQNLSWISTGGSMMSCLTRESRVYAYELDRMLGPQEILRCQGWATPSLTGISDRQVQDLAGEAQHLPCLAAVITGLVLAAGPAMPGVWSRSAAP